MNSHTSPNRRIRCLQCDMTFTSMSAYLHPTHWCSKFAAPPSPSAVQAAGLPHTHGNAGVEAGEIAATGTRTREGRDGTPAAPMPVAAAIASSDDYLIHSVPRCPEAEIDGRRVLLVLGGWAWPDITGCWRWTNSRSPKVHDIWNPRLIAALDERWLA